MMEQPKEEPNKPKKPSERRPPPSLKFFDRKQYGVVRGQANNIDIWVESAQLFVRLTPSLRRAVVGAANRFRPFRGAAHESDMVLSYHDRGYSDILVVSRRKLAEKKGQRIAIHDQQRDLFVLLPESVSEGILAEASAERGMRGVSEPADARENVI